MQLFVAVSVIQTVNITKRQNFTQYAQIMIYGRSVLKKSKQAKLVLSIRQWEGAPYKSKQIEIARLTREDGVGLQSLHLYKENETPIGEVNVKFDSETSVKALAHNDGLELNDWYSWFENYDFSKTLAIIHFTKIRY